MGTMDFFEMDLVFIKAGKKYSLVATCTRVWPDVRTKMYCNRR